MGIPNRYSLMAICLGFFLGISALVAPALAQEDPSKYSSRPIHLIVGFAAGGGNDIIARVFGQKLAESPGQPVIVENKPGGGAIVATEYVAKSAADGYTLLMSASGISINPAVYAKLPYDAMKDFVAVSETRLVSADHDRQCLFADQIGRGTRDLRQGQSGQDELRELIRLVPARDRIVQAEDRRADAGRFPTRAPTSWCWL